VNSVLNSHLQQIAIVSVLVVSVLLAQHVQASDLVVLHRGTDTVSAEPYLLDLTQVGPQRKRALVEAQRELMLLPPVVAGSVSEASFFPLRRGSLRVDQPQQLHVPGLTVPLFVLGMDVTSLQWLEDSVKELRSIGARGVVVQADSFQEFHALRLWALSQGVLIEMGTGDAIASMYALRRYPTLMVPP
jgi:integrating conjugative element protein (TIGR03765 family)